MTRHAKVSFVRSVRKCSSTQYKRSTNQKDVHVQPTKILRFIGLTKLDQSIMMRHVRDQVMERNPEGFEGEEFRNWSQFCSVEFGNIVRHNATFQSQQLDVLRQEQQFRGQLNGSRNHSSEIRATAIVRRQSQWEDATSNKMSTMHDMKLIILVLFVTICSSLSSYCDEWYAVDYPEFALKLSGLERRIL
ncbi:hypothetical protein DINM_000200 [Dirofilaria immitis]|nr:hypothetical protein [Dirofilaria immitis]